MSRDAAKGAAVALRRYAREQDAAAKDHRANISWSDIDAVRAALSVTRGEAARAVYDAIVAQGLPAGCDIAASVGRYAPLVLLRGSAPIPSATLDAWADGWDAYAARETDPGEPAPGPPLGSIPRTLIDEAREAAPPTGILAGAHCGAVFRAGGRTDTEVIGTCDLFPHATGDHVEHHNGAPLVVWPHDKGGRS